MLNKRVTWVDQVVALRCDTYIGFDAKALLKMDTSKMELEEVLDMEVYMKCASTFSYAVDALAALEQFARKSSL